MPKRRRAHHHAAGLKGMLWLREGYHQTHRDGDEEVPTPPRRTRRLGARLAISVS